VKKEYTNKQHSNWVCSELPFITNDLETARQVYNIKINNLTKTDKFFNAVVTLKDENGVSVA
jgi:hypothetical protein